MRHSTKIKKKFFLGGMSSEEEYKRDENEYFRWAMISLCKRDEMKFKSNFVYLGGLSKGKLRDAVNVLNRDLLKTHDEYIMNIEVRNLGRFLEKEGHGSWIKGLRYHLRNRNYKQFKKSIESKIKDYKMTDKVTDKFPGDLVDDSKARYLTFEGEKKICYLKIPFSLKKNIKWRFESYDVKEIEKKFVNN